MTSSKDCPEELTSGKDCSEELTSGKERSMEKKIRKKYSKKKIPRRGRSLKKRLYTLVGACLLPLTLMTGYLLTLMNNFSDRYDSIVDKITEISDYNINFKEDMDYTMYIIAVNADRADELIDRDTPYELIDDAKKVFNELYENETEGYGRTYLWRILKCLNILEDRVTEIEEDALVSGNYDLNMERLELNIYVLTDLIQEQIQKYIYYETTIMDELSNVVKSDVERAVSICLILIVAILILAGTISKRIMHGITEPINSLCLDMKRAGKGDFDVSANGKSDDELVTLNQGFNDMVERIGKLVEDIKEEQINLRTMELGLLQAQINPHFLYNTLDTITWLAETGENEKVVEMVDNLSTFFRISLSKGEDFITVGEEEQHTKSYLEIQKVRYEDVLNFEIDIPEKMHKFKMPKLTLQPLVENSIYHGIKNKRGGGTVWIKGVIEGDTMIFLVKDDGIGMTEERLEELRASIREDRKVEDSKSGFGVYNVNLRIRLYYGESYGITVESEYLKGTEVKLTLPIEY